MPATWSVCSCETQMARSLAGSGAAAYRQLAREFLKRRKGGEAPAEAPLAAAEKDEAAPEGAPS